MDKSHLECHCSKKCSMASWMLRGVSQFSRFLDDLCNTYDRAIAEPSLLAFCEPSQSERTLLKSTSLTQLATTQQANCLLANLTRSLRITAMETACPSWDAAIVDLGQSSQYLISRVTGTMKGRPRARPILHQSALATRYHPHLSTMVLTLFRQRRARSSTALSTAAESCRVRTTALCPRSRQS